MIFLLPWLMPLQPTEYVTIWGIFSRAGRMDCGLRIHEVKPWRITMRGYLPAGPAELQSSLVSIVPYLRPPFTLEKSKLLSIMLVDNLCQCAHMIGIPHEGRYAIPELDQQVKADGHSGGCSFPQVTFALPLDSTTWDCNSTSCIKPIQYTGESIEKLREKKPMNLAAIALACIWHCPSTNGCCPSRHSV
ncbi:hypothetical protein BJX68DRAFT_248197 [Aspergillus pseudodeflectus]|uniref:Uncharacterized protein n=1 Tax=Aspergillus pseudodeflectus TaxID=176178 RepID=A0ABR4JGJ1_9EURO